MPTPLQRLPHAFLLIMLASRPSAPAIDTFGYFQSEQEFGECVAIEATDTPDRHSSVFLGSLSTASTDRQKSSSSLRWSLLSQAQLSYLFSGFSSPVGNELPCCSWAKVGLLNIQVEVSETRRQTPGGV